MKKKFLTYFNLLLGTLSLSLAGCHVQKSTVNTDSGDAERPTIEDRDGRVICLYGVPATMPNEQELQPRTPVLPPEPEPLAPKYGPPSDL